MQKYDIWFGSDGDYVILFKLHEGYWRECTRWLIPNTQIED